MIPRAHITAWRDTAPRSRNRRDRRRNAIRIGWRQYRDRQLPAFMYIMARGIQTGRIAGQCFGTANRAQTVEQRLVHQTGLMMLTTTMAAMNTQSRTRTDVART